MDIDESSGAVSGEGHTCSSTKGQLSQLPLELVIIIRDYLPLKDLLNFLIALCIREWIHEISQRLTQNYGQYMALCFAVTRHPEIVVCALAQNLIKMGSKLPGNLVRWVESRSSKGLSPLRPSCILFLNQQCPDIGIDVWPLILCAYNNGDYPKVISLVNDNHFIPIPDCIEQQSPADLWIVLYDAYPEYIESIANDGYTLSLVEVCSDFLDSVWTRRRSDILNYMIKVGILSSDRSSISQLLTSIDYLNWRWTTRTYAIWLVRDLFPVDRFDIIKNSLLGLHLTCDYVHEIWPEQFFGLASDIFQVPDCDWSLLTDPAYHFTPIPYATAYWFANYRLFITLDEKLRTLIFENTLVTLYAQDYNSLRVNQYTDVFATFASKKCHVTEQFLSRMPSNLKSCIMSAFTRRQPLTFLNCLAKSRT